MTNETIHDDLLFNMLKECKTIPIFMDHIFGFLKRRTDFYEVAENENSHVGLPPGLAQSLVRQTFTKYSETNHKSLQNNSLKPFTCKNEPNNHHRDPAKSFNGSSFENYSWSQTYNEVDVYLKLPKNTSSKNLIVTTTANMISVKLKDGTCLLQGVLCQSCKLDPIWSIDCDELLLHLEKTKEIWWDRLLTNEPKIDISQIECTKPLEDLPEDAQAKIEELQWNQEQKRLGLPTSDEINSMNILKKAWHAEGSPFSGPFDPNAVSFN